MVGEARPWRVADGVAPPGGLDVRVRLTPRGGRDGVEGIGVLPDGTPVLKIRVCVAPQGGAANEAARRALADALGVPASAVALKAGATARVKVFSVSGNAGALAAMLDERFPGARGA